MYTKLTLNLSRTLLDYIGDLVDKRSQSPKDDLISKLVTEQVTPGHIDRADAVQIAFLMLVAGNATMVNMINLVSLHIPSPLFSQLPELENSQTYRA